MRVLTGLPGSRRCTIFIGPNQYLDAFPHAMTTADRLYVELVYNGFSQGYCYMRDTEAMRLQLDLARHDPVAFNFLAHWLMGSKSNPPRILEYRRQEGDPYAASIH